MTKFKIGDRVICIQDGIWNIKKGMKGTIVYIDKIIGVEWDTLINSHNCGGRCKNGKGYYISDNKIKLLKQTLKSLLE